MEPEEKELLERTFKVARENNKMLHAMRRNAMLATIFRLIFIAVAIGVPLWLYFNYLAPAMDGLMQVYGSFPGAEGGFNMGDFGSFFEQFRGEEGQ